jgi:membrane-bound acyltransferase YfiQ involved in biofilm formation
MWIGGRSVSFALYLIGTIILIAGVAYVAHLAHVPQHWIVAIAIVLLGAGVMGAVSSTRRRDPN